MANEIQRLYWNTDEAPVASANVEAGTFTLTFGGQTTSALDFDATDAEVQAAMEALSSIGSGNISVTAETNGHSFEFQGTLANTNVGAITFTPTGMKQKADTLDVVITQSGVAPVNEEQQVDIGGATTGTFKLNGNATQATVSTLDTAGIQAACDTIWGSGETVVASLGGDLFGVTFSGANVDATDHALMTVSDNTTDGTPVVTTTTDGVTGVRHTVTVDIADSPTEGTWKLADANGGAGGLYGSSNDIDWNSDAATAETAIENGSFSSPFNGQCSVSGSAPWTIEADDFFSDPGWVGEEGSTPLRKSIGAEIVLVQEGSAPTYTATVANTLDAITTSIAATFALPVYSATVANTLDAITTSIAATFVPPTYSATAANTLDAITASIAATATGPTSTATVASTLDAITVSIAATFVPPTYTATVASTLDAITVSIAATHTEPTYSATVASTLDAITMAAVAYSYGLPSPPVVLRCAGSTSSIPSAAGSERCLLVSR